MLTCLLVIEESTFPAETRGLAKRVADKIGQPELARRMLALLRERAPDERLALAFVLQLVEQSQEAAIGVLSDPARAADLVFCLGGSEMVGTGLCTSGAGWPNAFERARTESVEELVASIRCERLHFADRDEAARHLGEFKNHVMLRIAIADLLHRFDVNATTTALSRLADECIEAALDAAVDLTGASARSAQEFCVIGMGKLGAGELNLSSDIDLVYISDGNDGADTKGLRRIGELITELLSARCFRVDLRLRPGGRNSALVLPLEAALGFYQNFGDTWERAALLRARPIAGAIGIGARLIAELRTFIYRRFLDFDTLRQLRTMKRRIEGELRSPDMIERNVKLGYGGIRELEFIVQALTLIYGGRDARIRTGNTMIALERLENYGYMAPERARELRAAYSFLRDVEHKLQAAAGLQTHTLPAADHALAVVAARMGFGKQTDAAANFAATLRMHRELVATQFREMLAGGEERGEPAVTAAALAAWRAASMNESDAVLSALERLGFARPAETAPHLALLAHGPAHAPATARRRELMERLGPLLLDEIRGLADPNLALMNLAEFIAAIGARSSFLALLEEHPATRRVLLRLFASSAHLSTMFIRHPDMIDTLVRSDLARPRRTEAELAAELSGMLAVREDFEAQLDTIRSFGHQEFLRIAIADLANSLTIEEVQGELSRLAEAIVREALVLARSESATRYRIPQDLRLCVLAMGRLGAAEMSYNSDLDLIFIYDEPSETAASGLEWASRICQKLIAILEARTREGYAYKIDLRLRPSGNAGPLVTSLEGFREYHRQSSAVWERQALVRARVLAGNPALGDAVEEARQEFVFGHGLIASEVQEIATMRARMEHEIGAEDNRRLNLKQGRGGLVDVEFITQMMALRHGHRLPSLRVRSTTALIRALSKTSLMAAAEAEALADDYHFMTRLENRLRIDSDQAAWALPTNHAALTPLARRMGYVGDNVAAQLLDELERRRTRVRGAFEAIFAREQ